MGGTKSNRSQAVLLIFLAWLVYSISYVGKVNYSANITQVIDFYGVTKAQAGTPPTFFFFAYGIGQVLNGLFCKRYNIKWMVFGSFIVSALINFIIAVSSDFAIIKWLWMLNGISMSVLWPTLIRMLSENLPKKMLGTSSVAMGTTVATGTLVIYGLSSLFAAFDKFKYAFFVAAYVMVIVAIVWLIFYEMAVGASASAMKSEDSSSADVSSGQNRQSANGVKGLLLIVCILCFCAIGVNLVKDGLCTWVPSILKDEFSFSDSLSIILTLFLPVIAMFGNAFALKIHRKIPDYVNHVSFIFLVAGVLMGVIIAGLNVKSVVMMLGGLVVVYFLISSLNSVITSIFPMFMREKLDSGKIAGILNGFCYIGSTVSSYGLGAVADHFGWKAVFFVLMGFAAAVVAVWVVYTALKNFWNKKSI